MPKKYSYLEFFLSMIPKTSFIAGGETEAKYICFLAKSITDGFYNNSGYQLLPYPPKGLTKTCFFPDLNYSSTFWKLIKNCKNNHYNLNFPAPAVAEVAAHLEIGIAREVNYSAWNKLESAFFDFIEYFLDYGKTLGKLTKIEVLITDFGTEGSFFPIKTASGYELYMTKRSDIPVSSIGKVILLALDKIAHSSDGSSGDYLWSLRQHNVEYLLKNTAIKKILPDALDTDISNHANASKIVRDADNYMAHLGFPRTPAISVVNKKLTYQKHSIDHLFTKNEINLLHKLVESTGRTVSFDDAAEAVWGEQIDTKFSLYSLAKTIENIRRKIKSLGVYKEVIHTTRGVGYVLS